MKTFDYFRPTSIEELFQGDLIKHAEVIAGGTDLIPRLHARAIDPNNIVDISGLQELNFIRLENNKIQIGSLTTLQTILNDPIIQLHCPELVLAIKQIGAPMTRARGTLGGNIANASPAGDTLTPLLVHDSNLKLISKGADRTICLENFFIGPGETALKEGEIIHSLSFMVSDGRWGSSFKKIGPRKGMTISIVNAAALLTLDEQNRIDLVRIAVGSAAPTPVRCYQCEAYLQTKKPDKDIIQRAAEIALEEISPISDVRASLNYRKQLTKTLVSRVIMDAFQNAQERMAK